MPYELSDEKNLKKVLGVATYAGARLLTGSPEAASFLKDKVEKTRDFFDDGSDRKTISGIVEDIVGKSWEVALSDYELPIECRRELAQYNIMDNLDDWASIPTIRYNIARICSKYNVSLNTINTGDIARKLLRCIVIRVDDDPFLKTRDSLREIINNTEKANEKLDMILDTLNASKGKDPRLYGRLMERFINQRSDNPSIKMMTPDSSLFPIGIPAIISSDRTAVEGGQEPFSIKEMVLKSWEEHKNKHILLVGEGGIGKTVAMLTIPIEEWIRPYNIPAIYVPLNLLENYAGNLNEYISKNYINDIDGINERANSSWSEHPNLLLLLDGFNEIPMEFRRTAERHISEWMEKPGVQIITTSRISFFLDNDFTEYFLQPLSYETVRKYLISSGVNEKNIPVQDDNLWTVINVPLMLVIYLQIDKVKVRTNRGFGHKYLKWKDSDNAAHIIWNYLQVELYRHISVLKTARSISAASILAVAPYICFEMAKNGKFRVEKEEFKRLICKASKFFNDDQTVIPEQIEDISYRFDNNGKESLFDDDICSTHLAILTNQSVLFQTIEEEKVGELKIYYVPSHQNFRDALAAIFISTTLLNICKPEYKKGISEKIFDAADHYVKNYVSEYLSDEELVTIWDYHRKNEPENGSITWILMDLIGRKRNYDYSELNFSGMDLTKMKIHSLISRRKDICPLPQDAFLFAKTRIWMESVLPEGHTGPVNSVCYSPDGRNLASGSDDGSVRIWNLENGDVRILEDPKVKITSVSYSSDGRELAIGSNDGKIRIWYLKSGGVFVLDKFNTNITNVVYSPVRWQLAIALPRMVWIYDLEDIYVRSWEDFPNEIHSVTYSPDGKQLAIGLDDGTVRIWNWGNGDIQILKGHKASIYSVSFTPYERKLASGSYDKTIRIWDLKSEEAQILEGHESAVRTISYSPDGRQLVGGSDDGIIRIWNLENGDVRILLGPIGSLAHSLSYSPDGRQLAGGLTDSTVRIWDLESGEVRMQKGYQSWTYSVAYNPNRKQIACGSSDGTIRIWDLKNGDVRILEGHKSYVYNVSFSSDGKQLASGSDDKTIRIWDLENGDVRILEGHRQVVTSVAFSPDGKLLASAAFDDSERLWDLEYGDTLIISKFSGVYSMTFSPDGRQLASGLNNGNVRILNLDSGDIRILKGHMGDVLSVSYSPDGKELASGGTDNTVRMWDLENGKPRILEGHSRSVTSVSYSPVRKHLLASGSTDGTVRIWNLENGDVRILEGNNSPVFSVSFSSDGKQLVSGSTDGTVRIWDVLTGYTERLFRIVLGVNLNGLNLEQASISEEQKELFRECGAKVL